MNAYTILPINCSHSHLLATMIPLFCISPIWCLMLSLMTLRSISYKLGSKNVLNTQSDRLVAAEPVTMYEELEENCEACKL